MLGKRGQRRRSCGVEELEPAPKGVLQEAGVNCHQEQGNNRELQGHTEHEQSPQDRCSHGGQWTQCAVVEQEPVEGAEVFQ